MKKAIMKKLRSRSGETLAETLVALLIAAVALVMLASMISSTTGIVTQSKETIETYYAANNTVAEQGGASTSGSVTIAGDNIDSQSYEVSYDINSTFSGTPVISYSYKPTTSESAEP